MPDGSKLYVCPICPSKGKLVASMTVNVSYTAPLVKDGEIKLGRDKDNELTCNQCGHKVADRINGKWVMVGLVE